MKWFHLVTVAAAAALAPAAAASGFLPWSRSESVLDRLPAAIIGEIVARMAPNELVRFAATSTLYRTLAEDCPEAWFRAAFSLDTAEGHIPAIVRVLVRKAAACPKFQAMADNIRLEDAALLCDRLADCDLPERSKEGVARLLLRMNKRTFYPIIASDILRDDYQYPVDLLLDVADLNLPPVPDSLRSDRLLTHLRSVCRTEYVHTLDADHVELVRGQFPEPFGNVFPHCNRISQDLILRLFDDQQSVTALQDPAVLRTLLQNGLRFHLASYLLLNPDPNSDTLTEILPLLRISLRIDRFAFWSHWITHPADSGVQSHCSWIGRALPPYLPALLRTPQLVRILHRYPTILNDFVECPLCCGEDVVAQIATSSFIVHQKLSSLVELVFQRILVGGTVTAAVLVRLVTLPHLDLDRILQTVCNPRPRPLMISDLSALPSLFEACDRDGRSRLRQLFSLDALGRDLLQSVEAHPASASVRRFVLELQRFPVQEMLESVLSEVSAAVRSSTTTEKLFFALVTAAAMILGSHHREWVISIKVIIAYIAFVIVGQLTRVYRDTRPTSPNWRRLQLAIWLGASVVDITCASLAPLMLSKSLTLFIRVCAAINILRGFLAYIL